MAGRTRSDKQGRPAGERGGRPAPGGTGGRPGSKGRAGGRKRGPTPKGGRSAQGSGGRYTAPIPSSVRHSPKWYPWLLLGLLFLGIVVIILNYVQALPASPTNWYTLGGIVSLLAGALLATGYR